MSTALPTQHHSAHPTAMFAAVAAAVVLGSASAVGFAGSLDNAGAPNGSTTTSTQQHQQCLDPGCLPPAQRPRGIQVSPVDAPPPSGGATISWLP